MRQTNKKTVAFLGLLLVLMQVTSVLGEAGFRELDGYTYYFDADGIPLKGWHENTSQVRLAIIPAGERRMPGS